VGNVFVRFAYVDKRAFVEPHIALFGYILTDCGSGFRHNLQRGLEADSFGTRDLIEREIRSLPYFCTFLAYMVVAAIF